MRVFETAHDICVLPRMFMVARLDDRGFTQLIKEIHQFEAPFDERMRDLMTSTVEHLMSCGFNAVFGYTQSDEISLLFDAEKNAFQRKLRKFNSILSGEASAKFSLLLGDAGIFDCRISELPTINLVCDYFRWRSEDAHRNALNSHCYWILRKQGETVKQATKFLEGKSVAEKNELLWRNGTNFNDLPLWQKRGTGLYREEYEKQATNKLTGEKVYATRRRVKVDYELPMRDEFSEFIEKLLI
jgi:tRNA(His) guanylyltransferase